MAKLLRLLLCWLRTRRSPILHFQLIFICLKMHRNNDPQGEWNRIIQFQQQQQQLAQENEKQQTASRKRQYREELQKLMEDQKLSQAQRKSQENGLVSYQDNLIRQQNYEEYLKFSEQKNKAQEIAKFGKEQEELKREQQRQALLQERERQRNIANQIQEAQQYEIQNKLQEKQKVQRSLTYAYKQVEEQKAIESQLEKIKEQQILQEQDERLSKQDEQRQQFLMKLKQGYQQNSSVLRKYNDIYLEKEQQQREFQRKLIEEAAIKKQEQERMRFIQEYNTKSKMEHDTLSQIQNQINEKQHIRESLQQEKQQERSLNINIQQACQSLDKEQLNRKAYLQQQYRQELLDQIVSDNERKIRENQMNEHEANLNKKIIQNNSAQIGVIPGLYNNMDHHRAKQLAYVDIQLNRSVANADEIFNRKSRNMSAYQPKTNIFGY